MYIKLSHVHGKWIVGETVFTSKTTFRIWTKIWPEHIQLCVHFGCKFSSIPSDLIKTIVTMAVCRAKCKGYTFKLTIEDLGSQKGSV